MSHANCVPLEKKSFSRSSKSRRVKDGARISTARSGAPLKKPGGRRLSSRRRSLRTNETSGARQFRLAIQKPVLESRTRSEERRVGKECRSRASREHQKK